MCRSTSASLAVLEDMSLAAPVGSVLAIVGASGCGKSTLLNIIAGLAQADEGSVQIDGVANASPQDTRVISYMFQEDRLLPWRTIIANAEFGLEAGSLNGEARRERALEALRMTASTGSKMPTRMSFRAACAAAWHLRAALSSSLTFF